MARSDWGLSDSLVSSQSAAAYPPPLPRIFTFTAAQVLDALGRLAADQDWDIPRSSLTPNVIGRLLGQLRLQSHRTAQLRTWSLTAVGLARLARAYAVPIPPQLAGHFAAPAPLAPSHPP
jgi:hypothetical protein